MIEVAPRLYVGTDKDFQQLIMPERWGVVHACKEPYHRMALGYTKQGAPKDHPEYLYAVRNGHLILNLVDVEDPKYVAKQIVDKAIVYIDNHLKQKHNVLVHCNQGTSRGPGIAFAYLASVGFLPKEFKQAEEAFATLYPLYMPKQGIRGYIMNNWDVLRG